MPLASGADVGIGAYEFMLSTDVEEPYIHLYENLYGDESEIAGSEDKKTANKNILFWGYDDFRRGDGLRFWNKDQPDRWREGNNNPRIPGCIQGTPTATTATTITTGVTPTGGFFTVVGGRAWYFTGDQGYWSNNGTSWTENTDVATELPASYQITGACSDGEYAYFAASDGTNRGIWRVDSTTVVSDFVTAHAGSAYRAIDVRDQYLYAWTGARLFRYTHTGTIPITNSNPTHTVHNPRADPAGTVYLDIAAGDDAVYYSRASDGDTTLFEFKLDRTTGKFAGRSFWNLPMGFTGKKICVSSGIVYCLGNTGDRIGLWGYSIVNKQPLFLAYVAEEKTGTLSVRWLAPSYGAQVTMGLDDATTNYIYVYDAEEDAFSQLDQNVIATVGTMTAGATFESRRLAANFTTTSTKIVSWRTDQTTPEGTWTWVSSAHDLGFPQDEKVLLGFHVVQDPSFASGTINVDYTLDEDSTTFADAGTTAAGAKHTYLPVSDGSTTKKFRTIKIHLTGTNGCRLYSIIGRFYINSKQEVWKLNLDLRNEPGTTRRKSNTASAASKMRDNLHTLVSNGNVVTFKDGRRKRRKSSTNNTGYTTHTVLVEFPKDSVDSLREGTAEVILRSVAPSA